MLQVESGGGLAEGLAHVLPAGIDVRLTEQGHPATTAVTTTAATTATAQIVIDQLDDGRQLQQLEQFAIADSAAVASPIG